MSSITAADLKLGGRLVAACDAIGEGHLRRAAGIFNEIADDLNGEAEATTGLLSEEVEAPTFAPAKAYGEGETVADSTMGQLQAKPPQPAQPVDLQMCARGVHSYGPSDPVSGWRTCASCQMVNVAPPENSGAIDMSARQ